jgi:myo-inositol-1(or 4)-monophosphatase
MTEFSQYLREMAQAADNAYIHAMNTMTAAQRSQDIGLGGDGTPTMFLDAYIERPVLEIIEREGHNVLSEEVGWIDRGSHITVVIDPVDGTANSAAGVPISAFSAAIVRGEVVEEALITWLGTSYAQSAHKDDAIVSRVSTRTTVDGASLSMLRPRPTTWTAWSSLAQRAERMRILGSSVIEGALVADGTIDAFCDPGGDIHRIVDLAAISLIVEKSGGHVRDLHDRPFTFDPDLSKRWSGIIAGTRELVDEIAELIKA